MAKQDYYATLGVARGANGDDLKKAFRALAMKCQPDRNPGDKAAEQRFKDINEAYDVLKDDQKRAAYDRFGHAAFEQGGGRPGGPGDFGFAQGF
ncbi:MAG: DnaJ domain-containing protein, partial [Reyranella sp.]